MREKKYNIVLDQGSVYELEMELREPGTLFGSDLSDSQFRMQIRNPNREGETPALSLVSGTTTALGSTIEIFEEVIPPVTITKFEGAGKVEAVGAGFQVTTLSLASLDAEGVPTALVESVENVVQIGDLARIAGSISNDGDYRVFAVDSPDIIEVRPKEDNEAAQGTITVLRQGRFLIRITAEESTAWDFTVGEYDLEWISTSGAQPVRLLQGFISVDRETTR